MDIPFQSRWHPVHQAPPASEARQAAIAAVVHSLVKVRPLGSSPAVIQIYQNVLLTRQQLLHALLAAWDEANPTRHLSEDHAQALCHQAVQSSLSADRLQELALAVQACTPQTAHWQAGMTVLIQSLRLSGELIRPTGVRQDLYQEGLNRMSQWVCQHLHAYDPQRGKFIVWVNFRLKMLLRTLPYEQQDTFTQSAYGRILRLKGELMAALKQMERSTLSLWLRWQLQRTIATLPGVADLGMLFTVMACLRDVLHHLPLAGRSLLMEMAKAVVCPPAMVSLSDAAPAVEALAQPESEGTLLETVRQYFELDPHQKCQKHIRNHPQVTFQRIALSRLDHISWQELAETFGVGIPTLSNFYQRTLSALAPEIRQFVYDRS